MYLFKKLETLCYVIMLLRYYVIINVNYVNNSTLNQIAEFRRRMISVACDERNNAPK